MVQIYLSRHKQKTNNYALRYNLQTIYKYVVAVKREESQVVGHLMEVWKFAKAVIYFLKASENNDCVAVVCGRPINQGDVKGMKVICTLQFTGEEKFIKILKDQLEKLL